MKLKFTLLLMLLLAPLGLWAGTTDCGSGTVISPFCRNSQTIALGAGSITINNLTGGTVGSFEYLITGSPSTISVVLAGCMKGGTCETLDTYTTVANAIRTPSSSKVYDYYTITPTGTGGTNPALTVNTTITTAQLPPAAILAVAQPSVAGTTAGTYAAGDDSRIVNAVQKDANGSAMLGTTCPEGASANSFCITGEIYQNGQEFAADFSAWLPNFRLALGTLLSGGTSDAKVMCAGDSTTLGYGGSHVATNPSIDGPCYQLISRLNANGITAAPGFHAPRSNLTPGTPDSQWSEASWTLASYGFAGASAYQGTSSASGTLSFTPSGGWNYDTYNVYYFVNSGYGTLSCSANGGTPVAVSTAAACGKTGLSGARVCYLTASGTASTSGNVSCSITAGGTVFVAGVEPYLSTTPKLRVGIAGISSTQTAGWSSTSNFKTSDMVKALNPSLWILSLGDNDAASSVTASTFQTNMQAIISFMQTNNGAGSADVMLWTMAPPASASSSVQATYQPVYKALSKANSAPLVDVWRRYGGINRPAMMYNNTVHPNSAGYADISSAIMSALHFVF